MIKHTQIGARHQVVALTDKAARFLNTFVGRELVMDDKQWQSVRMEMGAHKVWVMGDTK
jgi:hypothetical protein